TRSFAPLYALGGKQPTLPIVTVGVTVPTAAPFSIDATGAVKPIPQPDPPVDPLVITSTTTEPIRAASIKCTEQPGAKQLLTNLDTVDPEAVDPAKPGSPKRRANTKVTVTYNDHLSTPLPPFALSTAGTTWPSEPVGSAAPFRIEAKSSTHVTFGLTIPDNATFSYLSEPADFAKVEFTYGLLAPIATSLTLTSDKVIATPKVGDTLTAAPPSGEVVSSTNPIYTWYELANTTDEIPTKARVLQNTSSNFYTLLEGQNTKFICCALSDGKIDKPKDKSWTSRPVYSDVTAQVAPAGPPPPPLAADLDSYSWPQLSVVADDLSAKGEGSVYYPHFSKF
ncbi:MAG: hypothetical protein RSF86_14925, partial [Angelakisella sp.]